jgi:hypothetical protein
MLFWFIRAVTMASFKFLAKQSTQGKPHKPDPEKMEQLSRLLRHYLSGCPPGSMERLVNAAKKPPGTGMLIWELARLRDMPLVVSKDIFLDMMRMNKGPCCSGECELPDPKGRQSPFRPFYDKYPEIAPGVRRALLVVKNGKGHVILNIRTKDNISDSGTIEGILNAIEGPKPGITHINSRRGTYYQVSVCGVPEEALLAAVEAVEAAAMALLACKELRQCPGGESARLARELGMEPNE